MRIDDILDETIELIIANMEGGNFKDIGALRKSEYQHSKGEEDKFLRSDMYKGTVAASMASKKANRGRNHLSEEAIEKGRKSRQDWYKDPKNKAKFLKIVEKKQKRLRQKKCLP